MKLYRELRKMPQREQLERAEKWLSNPTFLPRQIQRSIEIFSSYENREEAFCPTHESLSPPTQIATGLNLAEAFASAATLRVAGEDVFELELVEYELPPARTTTKAKHFLNRFEDGSRSTAAMKVDFLLRREDGTPVVGEAKVAKVAGFDSNSVLALVQVLAGATQLATPNQLERLSRYHERFDRLSWLDAAVFSYQPTTPAPARYQKALDRAACELVASLADSDLPRELRRVDFITVTGSHSSLELRLRSSSLTRLTGALAIEET
jgi:hypothetical protein